MRNLKQLWFIGVFFGTACSDETMSLTVGSSQGGSTTSPIDEGLSQGGGTAISIASIGTFGGSNSMTIPSVPEERATALAPHSRNCIEEALARQALAAGGSAATAQEASRSGATMLLAAAGHAGAGSAPTYVSAEDLGLGSGDLTVLVLFDQSGSMGSPWDERTKWQVANDSLLNALEPVLDLVTIGTIFFPQPSGCDVAALDSGQQIDFMSGRNFRTRWEQTAESRGPNGSTPLHLALEIADHAIENACKLGLLERRFRVVIVTDGEPNCGVDTATLPVRPAEWYRLGVETRVMGLPGSQGALELMNQIAQAGGTGTCVSLGSPQQMRSEMQSALL